MPLLVFAIGCLSNEAMRKTQMTKSLIAIIATISCAATVAFGQMSPTKIGNSAEGKVLTNDNGMTLYVFDKESAGKSACNGPCAGNWPH